MKIRTLQVSGFKSLNGFSLEFEKFNCLIGANGAGKSTVLQVLDFVSAVASNQVYKWLDVRGLSVEDITSNIPPRKRFVECTITFDVKNKNGEIKTYWWSVILSRGVLSLRAEIFGELSSGSKQDRSIFIYKNGEYSFYGSEFISSPFMIFGSALASLPREKVERFVPAESAEAFSEHLAAFDLLKEIKSFDMLAPNLLRKKQKRDSSVIDIGLGGEYLGSFIHNLTSDQREELLSDVRQIYPGINSIQTKVRKFGWVELSVNESVFVKQDGVEYKSPLNHTAKVLNDGVLRVVAILAQKFTRHSMILFDEIENGVNSEITQKVMDSLLMLDKQVVVTTHSPVVLNYIPEDVATKSVHLIYRGSDGASKETLFFSVPSVHEKLVFLPPGDAMLDVYLEEVAAEAIQKKREWELEKPRSELKKGGEASEG